MRASAASHDADGETSLWWKLLLYSLVSREIECGERHIRVYKAYQQQQLTGRILKCNEKHTARVCVCVCRSLHVTQKKVSRMRLPIKIIIINQSN